MPAFTEPSTVPPFPTRFPPAPRLTLTRRRWASGDDDNDAANPALSAGEADRLARQIEHALILRERAVSDAEARLAERIRDLDEMEALLRAREALLSATRLRDSGRRDTVTPREAAALNQLREELDRQEASLREARQALGEREQFMERSETQLLAKAQEQQEHAAELDQREENLLAREARLKSTLTGKPASPPPAHPRDEFRE